MASRPSKETGRAAASKTGKGTGRAAAKMPEVELAQTTRLGQIMALPVEVIRLHLQQRHLSVTGNKREAAKRGVYQSCKLPMTETEGCIFLEYTENAMIHIVYSMMRGRCMTSSAFLRILNGSFYVNSF